MYSPTISQLLLNLKLFISATKLYRIVLHTSNLFIISIRAKDHKYANAGQTVTLPPPHSFPVIDYNLLSTNAIQTHTHTPAMLISINLSGLYRYMCQYVVSIDYKPCILCRTMNIRIEVNTFAHTHSSRQNAFPISNGMLLEK